MRQGQESVCKQITIRACTFIYVRQATLIYWSSPARAPWPPRTDQLDTLCRHFGEGKQTLAPRSPPSNKPSSAYTQRTQGKKGPVSHGISRLRSAQLTLLAGSLFAIALGGAEKNGCLWWERAQTERATVHCSGRLLRSNGRFVTQGAIISADFPDPNGANAINEPSWALCVAFNNFIALSAAHMAVSFRPCKPHRQHFILKL